MERLACIGIGSNAIRLLIACREGERLYALRRERRGTRLFAGLVNGALTQQSVQSSVEAVGELAALARADGARELFIFATSAVRDAANGGEFTARAEDVSGARVEIVTGEEEAVLSYLGASEGGSCGVIDIGGGSTEFTLGEGSDIFGAVSLQMGAVRMNALQPIESRADYRATVERCQALIARDAQALLRLPKRESWVGVGGTMTTLGAMERRVALFSMGECEGMSMTLCEVSAWGDRLAALSIPQRRKIVGLMPQRADIIPSGVAILEAAMRSFGITAMTLSAHGNMDGYLKRRFGCC